MNGDRRDVSDRIHIPDLLEQFLLAKDMIWMLCQKCQKFELLGRKLCFLAPDPYTSCRLVYLDITDLEGIALGLLIAAHQTVIACQMSLYPCN